MTNDALSVIRGAHACSVRVSAFCRNELVWFRAACPEALIFRRKFATTECRRQHAASVRSPELSLGVTYD